MTEKQYAKTVELVQSGHCVRIRSGPFVHEFARIDPIPGGSRWTIANNVLAPKPLIDVSFNDLTFFKRVEVDA